jgi:ubiquinone/menaquinone biosynthesis C-methylase UbiE
VQGKDVRSFIRERYGKIAKSRKGNSCSTQSSCGCGSYSETIGYSIQDLNHVPEGSDLGLGCGNPTISADIKEGEVVLDLGSGAGFDCFLAANKVGHTGKVIGVDMTPEMVERARVNAQKGNYTNVEFRLGEIEHLPVESQSIDLIISNCVINLSPNKAQVFKEAYRVLKSNGRMIISDLVVSKELPEVIRENLNVYAGCIGGALVKEQYLKEIEDQGFEKYDIIEEKAFPLNKILSDELLAQVKWKDKNEFENLKNLDHTIISLKVKIIKS